MEAGALDGAGVVARAGWSAPWFAPLRDLGHLLEAADVVAALNEEARRRDVRTSTGHPLRFVAADDARGRAYEAHIAATGRVPTRLEGAGRSHDLFNALVWLALPHTKAALNQRQASEIERDGVGSRRGPVRDAATLLDESGLLLCCADEVTQLEVAAALARHDWAWLAGAQRARWHRDIAPVVFGHALLDKLQQPYKRLTAAVALLTASAVSLAAVDAAAARFVDRPDLAPGALTHLPVLGVPGWWPDNEDPAFYEDSQVFRPAPLERAEGRMNGRREQP